MKRTSALAISMIFLFMLWYFAGQLFNFEIGGIDLPIIGHIDGWKPLMFLTPYSSLLIGGFTILVYYVLTKNMRGRE